MISKGMSVQISEKVTEMNTARALGSGSLAVYATPAMILLVEKAAMTLLEGNLDNGMTTVGTEMSLEHIAPSPVGMEIFCQVTLSDIDRRMLTFDVEVRDEAELIGRGSHRRFIVEPERFQRKANEK